MMEDYEWWLEEQKPPNNLPTDFQETSNAKSESMNDRNRLQ